MEIADSDSSPPPPSDDDFNVWELLDRSLPRVERTEADKPDEAKDKAVPFWERMKYAILLRICDGLGLAIWTYILVKLFVADVDRTVFDAVFPSAAWILGYRILAVIAGAAVVGIFFWRWTTVFVLVYVMLFPLIVVVWKLPAVIVRRRSWMLAMMAINSLSIFLRDLRYNIISKGIAILAAFAIVATSAEYVLIPAAGYLAALLGISTYRIVRRTFEQNWFLTVQKNAIDAMVSSSFVKAFSTLDRKKLVRTQNALTSVEVNDVLTKIQMAVFVNRTLYLWAHKLDQYRQSRLSILFNISAYVWQFVGAAVVFTLLNIALLEIDPGQYSFSHHPSDLALTVYSVSNLALNDGGGVSADKDVAFLLRLLAGVYGVLFLAVFLVNVVLTFVRERDDVALKQTVRDLRARARQHDDEFRDEMKVGVDEAFQRLQALGQEGVLLTLKWFSPPPEFIDPSASET